MFVAASVVMCWQLGRPALWLDEAASVVATQRSWSGLWLLLRGPDAPLVPYYAVLKVVTQATRAVIPGLAGHPEVLYRWSSAAAMALACAVLISWLSRSCALRLVLAVGVLLLAVSGVSRYGQEARTYAFVMLLAVVATLSWVRLATDRRRRWIAGYGLALALLVVLQPLAAALVAGHLVAAVLLPDTTQRRRAVVRTLLGAGAGLLVAAPQVVTATTYGGGATGFPAFTVRHVLFVFVQLFSSVDHPVLFVGPVLLLAIVGLSQTFSARYPLVRRLAAAWGLVPPAVLLPAVALRPNLLIGRYLLFVVPAWAILAGFGVLAAMDLTAVLVRRLTASASPVVPGIVAAIILGLTVVAQLGSLEQMRGPAGHGEDVRPSLAEANRPAYRRLPIVITSGLKADELQAYDRSDLARVVNLREQHELTTIWPATIGRSQRRRALDASTRFILLERRTSGRPCASPGTLTSAPHVEACLQLGWLDGTYRVLAVHPGGRDWSFSELARVARTSADDRPQLAQPTGSQSSMRLPSGSVTQPNLPMPS